MDEVDEPGTAVITRVITFFFPYDSKVEEYSNWHPGGDPRDFTDGHPHGHETWGHGRMTDHGWVEYDDQEMQDWTTTIRVTTSTSSSIAGAIGSATQASSTESSGDVASDSAMAIFLAFYTLFFVGSFVSNVLTAGVIKKYRWGMKMALLFHLCLTGAFLCVTNSLHFVASGYHLVSRRTNVPIVLQLFAISAWIDHAVGYALLIFVMYLAIFCFKFYWSNKTRSTDWGRSKVLYAVVSAWIIAFLLAGFTAYFQCDSHFEKDQCVRIVCTTSNIFSAIFTELLTRVRIVIPIVILLTILLSVRVGSSKQRRESFTKIEGADTFGDRELLLLCSLLFLIYEAANIIPQLLVFFCISPMISVFSNHFGVLLSTLATPIAVLAISHNMRNRWMLMYSCGASNSKTAPKGNFAHVAKKYRESVDSGEDASESRRQSIFSQELSSSGASDNQRKLSTIAEEAANRIGHVETVATDHVDVRSNSAPFAPRRNSLFTVASASHAHSISHAHISNRRHSLAHDLPPVEGTSLNKNLMLKVQERTEKFGLHGSGPRLPNVHFHLPQHIFVHHSHEGRVKPAEIVKF